MKYRIYTPQSATLPSNSTVHREPLGLRNRFLGRQAPEPSDFLQFETHALVHDIFLAQEVNQVVAIGPPLLNLSSDLSPLRIVVDGVSKPIKARVNKRDRFNWYTFDLPSTLRDCDNLSLQLSFADRYTYEFNVERQSYRPVNLQLITLQKNNAVAWVLDWIRYYEHLGVERILLYDNGSNNLSEIEQALENITSSIDLVLIPWPYKFGPRGNTSNRFCQSSRTNHAFECFGQATWVAVFDLDEYLVVEPDKSVTTATASRATEAGALTSLTQRAGQRVGQLRFDSYWVPNVASTFDERSIDSVPTVRSFPYREKRPRGTAHKYLVRQRALRYAKTHNCRLKFGYTRKHVPVREAVFLHYKALTDEWKAGVTPGDENSLRGRSEALSEKDHEPEARVIEAMRVIDRR